MLLDSDTPRALNMKGAEGPSVMLSQPESYYGSRCDVFYYKLGIHSPYFEKSFQQLLMRSTMSYYVLATSSGFAQASNGILVFIVFHGAHLNVFRYVKLKSNTDKDVESCQLANLFEFYNIIYAESRNTITYDWLLRVQVKSITVRIQYLYNIKSEMNVLYEIEKGTKLYVDF